jgi:superfamily II DNA or RNA helicase
MCYISTKRLNLENNTTENSNLTIEQRAISLLETYQGANNYILKLKHQKETNKRFFPTRAQCDYIINYYEVTPKVAKRWVDLDPYFAKKIADEKLLLKIPEQVWVEKLLVEKEKSYHVWGKVLENETIHEFWLPKGALIKTHTIQNVVVDYSKYSNRPPLEHQKEAIEKLAGSKRFILADDMGLGKAEFVENKVFTPYGRKRIGDLKIGDEVIGSDGNKCSIKGVYPQGVKDLYRVTFNDGASVLVCKEHLFSVKSRSFGFNTNNSRNKEGIVLSVEQMLNNDLFLEINGSKNNINKKYKFKTYYKETGGNNKWQIPMVKPIEFNSNELELNPYLLGLILGDGGITQKGVSFTTEDVEIIDYIKPILPENSQITENKNSKYGYRLTKKTGHTNPIIQILKELDLMGCGSHNKFIPTIYKYSSINDRLEILKGLMDTDGTCSIGKKGNFEGTEFSTVSERLCDDVIEIVHSLGGIARKKSRTTNYTYKGEKKEGKKSYRVNIKLPSGMNPFKLKRKYDLYNTPEKYKVGRYIKDIKFEGSGEAICISVDSPDKLYVTEHAIVTHNTTSTIIAALETGAKKILIICPASLKINWQREIENYTDRSVYISEGKNFSIEHDFVIVNYDILKNFYDLKDKDNSLITQGNFDLIILDEAHYVSNGQAARTKLVNSFSKKCERVWLLTGTPMTNRPMNYFNLLSLVESPAALNWMAYAIRYCGGYQFTAGTRKIWNVAGATNLEELRDRTSRQVLRRLKTEVLDLPEKIITPVYLRLKSKLYEGLMGEYYDWYNRNPDESTSLTVQFSKLMKVRQVIAEEKIKDTIELAENILEQDKKVIIFTNFTETLNRIADHFGKQAVRLDGSTSKPQRQYAVDQFQDNEKIKVFVGNVKAAGVGITLTAAEAVIINDLSFVPGDLAQAEDRAYRYGQKNSVSVYYPIFDNSIEGIIYDMVNQKKQNIGTVMGDNLEEKGDFISNIMNKINNRG